MTQKKVSELQQYSYQSIFASWKHSLINSVFLKSLNESTQSAQILLCCRQCEYLLILALPQSLSSEFKKIKNKDQIWLLVWSKTKVNKNTSSETWSMLFKNEAIGGWFLSTISTRGFFDIFKWIDGDAWCSTTLTDLNWPELLTFAAVVFLPLRWSCAEDNAAGNFKNEAIGGLVDNYNARFLWHFQKNLLFELLCESWYKLL